MTKILIHTTIKNKKIRKKKIILDLQLEILLAFIWKITKMGSLWIKNYKK